eukprot:TRINITY_DN1977_c0_g1_i1.p1 TRINITY_DN1977_c0_g1~~TRINITY_DN1977_c0_g1_i1.p1  ORF type:complete len:181 (-),score=16.57 TRINITY_DN1977_c0_g1_i1:36-578(-)
MGFEKLVCKIRHNCLMCGCSCGRSKDDPPEWDAKDCAFETMGDIEALLESKQMQIEPSDDVDGWLERRPTIRDPKYTIVVTFERMPLGLKLASSVSGQDAYVTSLNLVKNQKLKHANLPLNSKLLKVGERTVEGEFIDMITEIIVQKTKSLPLVLTFCHPHGLDSHEFPDPHPERTLKRK